MSVLTFWATSALKQDSRLPLVSLPSPGISPWKYFIEHMKEDTSHLHRLLCQSWLPLYCRRKWNWAGLRSPQNTVGILYTVSKQLSLSKPLLIICLMMHPRRLPRTTVLLAGLSVKIAQPSENMEVQWISRVETGQGTRWALRGWPSKVREGLICYEMELRRNSTSKAPKAIQTDKRVTSCNSPFRLENRAVKKKKRGEG